MIKKFLVSWFFMSLSVSAASYVVADVEIRDIISAIKLSFFLGLVNATIRPILVFVSMPFIVLTFGVLAILINTGLLYIAAFFAKGIMIKSFFGAVVMSILISIFSWLYGLIFRTT